MVNKRVTLKGILCHCEADQTKITFLPELGKEIAFEYKDILTVKSREGQWNRNGKFIVIAKNGKSIDVNIFYKQNRSLKRMLMFLMEQVPGDVTFKKTSAARLLDFSIRTKSAGELICCPKCHSTEVKKNTKNGIINTVRKKEMVCRKCGHYFVQ